MIKNIYPGKLIVFEGVDGSGKATQAKILLKRLRKEKIKAIKIDFPQYGKKSAALVEEYLNGGFGSSKEVSPYQASIFYACDRFAASSRIRNWLKNGFFVIADRYVGSNIGHQGGKIKDKGQRKNFLKWLYRLEYGIFKIPKPDLNIFLKTNPLIGDKTISGIKDREKLVKRKKYLGRKKKDIHEKDSQHLKSAFNAYIEATKIFPKDFFVIECIEGSFLKPPQEIHQLVWKIIEKII